MQRVHGIVRKQKTRTPSHSSECSSRCKCCKRCEIRLTGGAGSVCHQSLAALESVTLGSCSPLPLRGPEQSDLTFPASPRGPTLGSVHRSVRFFSGHSSHLRRESCRLASSADTSKCLSSSARQKSFESREAGECHGPGPASGRKSALPTLPLNTLHRVLLSSHFTSGLHRI